MNSLRLGAAIGGISKSHDPHQAIRLVREAGFTAIELSDKNEETPFTIQKRELEGFSYVSFHAPVLPYGDNPETRRALRAIEAIHAVRPLDLAVFHPDPVKDFSVFSGVSFPVAFENMDWRRASHQNVEDMERTMERDPAFKLVLDVNHIYTNDRTLALAEHFYRALGHRLAEIHLSGFATVHDPLFQTQQDFLITLIRDFSLPIILEGVGKIEELAPERDYVLRKIENILTAR